MEIGRRGLLKGIGSTVAAAALPPAVLTNLVAPVVAEIPAVTVATENLFYYVLRPHPIFKDIGILIRIEIDSVSFVPKKLERIKAFKFKNYRHIARGPFRSYYEIIWADERPRARPFFVNKNSVVLDKNYNIVRRIDTLYGEEVNLEDVIDDRDQSLYKLIDRHAC